MIKTSKLIVFNKPFGVISQFSPHPKYKTLKEFISAPDFYPAGRLDSDSEGLLLLSNDGKLQTKISHPKNKVIKTYYAQLEGVQNEHIEQLRGQINLGDFITQPAEIRLLTKTEIDTLWPRNPPIRFRKNIPTFWLKIKINEGKNRQVRRMTAKVGFPCLRLIRVAIGNINLFDLNLEVGAWQYHHHYVF